MIFTPAKFVFHAIEPINLSNFVLDTFNCNLMPYMN